MNKIVNFVIWPAVAGLVFALALLQVPRLSAWFPGLIPQSTQTPVSIQGTAPMLSYVDAIRRAMPAVVSINSQVLNTSASDSNSLESSSLSNLLTQKFNGFNQNNSLGSGVIISPEGYIITSSHIFSSPENDDLNLMESITVTLSDGRSLDARPLLFDEDNDLGLLKIDAGNLPYLEPVTSSVPEVGESVIAIGNPRNLGLSASVGIISALHRSDNTDNNNYLIQTDAAINPGNSGGPLVDMNGRLIGINSTILSESGGSEGLGFAIPAILAKTMLDYYLDDAGGFLGVGDARLLTLEEGMARFGMPIQGALVTSVLANSPAENAGIRPGDVIVGVNQKRFDTLDNDDDLFAAIGTIRNYGSGENITINIFRNSQFLDIPVTLGVGEPFLLFSPVMDGDSKDKPN